jgi:hypothetical protein
VNAKHDPALAEVSDEMDKVEEEIATIFEKARVRTHTPLFLFHSTITARQSLLLTAADD